MAQDKKKTGLSTNPDDYVRMPRLNLVLAAAFAMVGVWLMRHGIDPKVSLRTELLMEIGRALVTAAVIDLILLSSFERFKIALADPFIKAALREQERTEAFSHLIATMQAKLDKINEETFRIGVRTDLDLIKLDLEAIQYAVDPAHREIVDAVNRKKQQSDNL